jgi:hypothetical protein
LEQLRRQHLPRFADYEFAKHLEEKIPDMYMRIKDNVKGEFTAWLSTIKERSRVLGELAMEQMEEQLRGDEEKDKARRRKGRSGSMASIDMVSPTSAAASPSSVNSSSSIRSPTKGDSREDLKSARDGDGEGKGVSARGHRRGSATINREDRKKLDSQPEDDVVKEEEWDEG